MIEQDFCRKIGVHFSEILLSLTGRLFLLNGSAIVLEMYRSAHYTIFDRNTKQEINRREACSI
jgi:hypothetical protein